ncbi:LOW QUALITY PROTEIN: uncharacterized protein RDI95_007582 [Morus bassanus]
MGRVLFVFQCATKRHLKTSKLVTKWNIHPAHTRSMALNLDIFLEKQQCSDPAVPLHFETSCLPLTSIKTSEAQLKSEEKQLQSNIESVADCKTCLFIKQKEGQIREEMRSPRRAHKKWPPRANVDVATDCARTAEGSCGKRLNKFSCVSCLHWGGLSAFRSLLILSRKDLGVIEMDSRLKPQVRQRCRA